jgi:hypothetical protein
MKYLIARKLYLETQRPACVVLCNVKLLVTGWKFEPLQLEAPESPVLICSLDHSRLR